MSSHASNARGTHAELTKHADTVGHQTRKSFKTDRRDKPKHSGKNISQGKKGGAGAKTTWGRPGDEAEGIDEIVAAEEDEDADLGYYYEYDPSYYQPSQASQLKFATSQRDLQNFKQVVRAAAKEYAISSNDVNEVCRILNEQGMSLYHADLPAILFKYSLDLQDQHRHRLTHLVVELFKKGFVSANQMAAGIRKLYNALPDMSVDVPHARTFLREHCQFVVASGCLSAELFAQLESEYEKLSDSAQVQKDKSKIEGIIDEYLVEQDLNEAANSLREMKVPHLHYEIVKYLISTSLDRGNREREAASIFLSEQVGRSSEDHLLRFEDVEKGFTLLLERVDDLVLDIPDVLRLLSVFVARAVVDEVLSPAFLLRVDLSSSDLGSQVVDQAQRLTRQEAASDRLLHAWEELEEEEREKKAAMTPPQAAATRALGEQPAKERGGKEAKVDRGGEKKEVVA